MTRLQYLFLFCLVIIAIAIIDCSDSTRETGLTDYLIIEDWIISDLVSGDNESITILGNPEITESPWGDAVVFNGDSDAIFLDYNPLIGLSRFTIEVIMWPDSDGQKEQRYLHFGLPDSNRVLMETRLTDHQWYHDSYVYSDDSEKVLKDANLLHPSDTWYHVALVFDNGTFSTYMNGEKELTGFVPFTPQNDGKTSIGSRLNEIYWYKGKFYRIRISNQTLKPEAFLELNPSI